MFYAEATPSSNTWIVDNSGDGDYTTIQEAVDNAATGDTIKIMKHSSSLGWQEEVTVNTPGLKIIGDGKSEAMFKKQIRDIQGSSSKSKKSGDSDTFEDIDIDYFFSDDFLYGEDEGCPTIILDGADDGGSANDVLIVNAADVTIENIFTRHGKVVLNEGSSGSRILNSCLLGSRTDVVRSSGTPERITVDSNFFIWGRSQSVELKGNQHIIIDNVLSPSDNGIKITGDDGTVIGNVVLNCNDQCIEYNGDYGTITDNSLVYFSGGIEYTGNDGIVRDNYLKNGDYGIYLTGDNPIIRENYFEGIDHKFIKIDCSDVVCSDGFIERNVLISGYDDDEGILLKNFSNFVIDENKLSYISEDGLELQSCNNNIISNNKFSRNGAGQNAETPAILLTDSSQNKIISNDIHYSTYSGIVQNGGSHNVYQDNYIFGCGDVGIVVLSGNTSTIDQNEIINGQGEGIAILGGDDTSMENNVVRNNRIDVCMDGGTVVTFEMKNEDFSGGLDQACAVAKRYSGNSYDSIG